MRNLGLVTRRAGLAMLLYAAIALVVVPVLANGQAPDADHPSTAATGGVCLLIGAGISALIALAKTKIVFIAQNPKLVATVLSIVVAIAEPFIAGHSGMAWGPMALCALTQLAAAVTTHEVAIKPITQG